MQWIISYYLQRSVLLLNVCISCSHAEHERAVGSKQRRAGQHLRARARRLRDGDECQPCRPQRARQSKQASASKLPDCLLHLLWGLVQAETLHALADSGPCGVDLVFRSEIEALRQETALGRAAFQLLDPIPVF